MKTIHQMTKEEFVQVFGYYQNDNKAISFVDEESAKEFILVAIKHEFSVEEYEISKTFLPLYISTYTDRLLSAFYLLSKNPLDSEYFICYKKDSVWAKEENRWVETKTIHQMTPREFVQAMNNLTKEQETSLETTDTSKSEEDELYGKLDKVKKTVMICMELGLDISKKVFDDYNNIHEELRKFPRKNEALNKLKG